MGNNRNSKRAAWLAQAALMLVLLYVVQLITIANIPLLGQIITGSLVNLVLIVAGGSIGLSASIVAAISSPAFAFLMGKMAFAQMIPVIAAGNVIIVVVAWAFFRNRHRITFGMIADVGGIVFGAVAKWLFLWGATLWIMLPVVFGGEQTVASKLGLMFSWPQLVTALIGGVLALFVLPAIRSYNNKRG